MRGHSIQHPFEPVNQSYPGSGAHHITAESVLRNAATAVVGWLIGIQFLAGVHVATTGSFHYAINMSEGLTGSVLTLAVAAIAHSAGVRLSRSGFGVAMALSLLFIGAAFCCGEILSTIWTSMFGSFPDMSGLGNRMLP